MAPVQTSPSDGPTPLRAAANAILDSAKSSLAAAPAADATRAIHDFRVAMKRWRAFLRLVEPFISEEAVLLRREATLLTRNLGASRDAQAACDAFSDIVKAADSTEGFDDGARQAIEARLAKLRGTAESGALGSAALQRLSAAVARAETEMKDWPLDDIAFADLAAGLAGSYRRARRRRPQDFSKASDADLHEFRKAVVILRYQVDIVAPLWPRMWRTFASELQRLRTQLGKSNDLTVLSTLAEPRAPLSRWKKHIAARVATRRQQHAQRAQRIAGRVFSESPRAFRRRLLELWNAAQPS